MQVTNVVSLCPSGPKELWQPCQAAVCMRGKLGASATGVKLCQNLQQPCLSTKRLLNSNLRDPSIPFSPSGHIEDVRLRGGNCRDGRLPQHLRHLHRMHGMMQLMAEKGKLPVGCDGRVHCGSTACLKRECACSGQKVMWACG